MLDYEEDIFSDMDSTFEEILDVEPIVKESKKRGRPKGSKNTKKEKKVGYFYEEEEQAVIDYINAETKEEKDYIFNNKLKIAFTKMIEAIIRRYRLFPPDEEFQENFNDTISFILMKLHLFDKEKGYKAYSYIQTICKNYLIYKINTYNKNLKRNASYEDMYENINDDDKYSYSIDDANQTLYSEILTETIKNIEKEIESEDAEENDILVGRSLIFILSDLDNTFPFVGSNKYNKASFMEQLEESTNLGEKEIKVSMKKFKSIYFLSKHDILN